MHMDKVRLGDMLDEMHDVFYANDHPALNEPCVTILSCLLAITR